MEPRPKYTCPRCHYKTDERCNYAKHLNRKTPCDSLYSVIPVPDLLALLNQEKQFKCDRCDKSYSQLHGLSRHKKVHTHEPTIAINNTTDSHDTNITTTNNSHNTTVIIENLHLTVQILPFGKEDISSIQNDMEFLNRCIRQGVDKAIPDVVKEIFLNQNLPQNQNVKLGKEHHPAEMKVYKADTVTGVPAWELAPRSRVLQELVEKGATVLQTHNNHILNTSGGNEEAKDKYDRRNTKLIDVKSKKRGTAGVKQAVLSKFRDQQANTASTTVS